MAVWPGGQAAIAVGGPSAAVNRSSQSSAQGQFAGSRSWTRRAERTGRAGTLISWRRIVAVVALAWKREASAPAARVRLNAIAASTSQAPLAVNCPEGRCASGPFFRSAMTCSMIAWRRWSASACDHRQGRVGEHGVVAPGREQLALLVRHDGGRGWRRGRGARSTGR